MFKTYQPWDPLRTCVVGRSYPPEFFSWVQDTRARTALEKVAEESEEDFQLIVKKLEEFNVQVLRPDLPVETFFIDRYIRPPMTPRDHLGMIGETFYENASFNWQQFYHNVKDPSWPDCDSFEDFHNLPDKIQQECYQVHHLNRWVNTHSCYNKILGLVKQQGNTVKSHLDGDLYLYNRAMCWPLGKDLLFGTWSEEERPAWKNFDLAQQKQLLDREFANTTNHVINTQGHADSSFCPVVPGLILSLDGINFDHLLPDWEVVHFDNGEQVKKNLYADIRSIPKNFYIPGFENDQDLTHLIETKLQGWTGYSAETVFDISILNIDEKNILTFGTHEPTLNLLEKRGITVHQIPFRHRWFWDGGVHCVTCDLDRHSSAQDYNLGPA